FEANKESVVLRVFVPPDHDEMIEPARRAIRAALADQRGFARAQSTVGGAPTLGAIWELFAGFHGFGIVPVAHKGPGELRYVRSGSGFKSRACVLPKRRAAKEN